MAPTLNVILAKEGKSSSIDVAERIDAGKRLSDLRSSRAETSQGKWRRMLRVVNAMKFQKL